MKINEKVNEENGDSPINIDNVSYQPIFECLNVYSSSMFFHLKPPSPDQYSTTTFVTTSNRTKENTVPTQNNVCGNFKILRNLTNTNNKIFLLEWHPKPFFLNKKYTTHQNISSNSSFSSSDVSLEEVTLTKQNNKTVDDHQRHKILCTENTDALNNCFMDDQIMYKPECNVIDDSYFNALILQEEQMITPINTLKHCVSSNDMESMDVTNKSKFKLKKTKEYLSYVKYSSKERVISGAGTQRSSSFVTKKRSLRMSPYVDNNCVAYHPMYREYSAYITTIKIYVSERNHDCGYLVVNNIEGISKAFNFLRGGIKNLMHKLNSFKWFKPTNRTKKYKNDTKTRKQIFYKNTHFITFDESPSNTAHYDSIVSKEFFINKPVDRELFSTFFNSEGQLIDVYNFKRFGYLYGFNEDVRPDAWKFIFGFYAFSSTHEERIKTEKTLCNEYRILSLLRTKGESNSTKPDPYLSIIEKDVIRTDRKNPFFAGDDNPNLVKMKNILLCYSYYRPNIGYSQGMSDLLAPILSLLKNESDSFWCFVGFMETLLSATLPSEDRMDHMMFLVFKLMKQICPDILNFLRRNDLELSMIFLHRWFILSFQREFSLEQGFRVWEACWFCPILDNGYFQIFVAVGIMLKYHKKTKCKRSIFYHAPDEILNFFTNIIKIANADDVLKKARKLVARIKQSSTLPCELRVFLFSPIGWNHSFMPEIRCNCLNKNKCVYKNWTLNNKMEKLIIDSVKSFRKQHPKISSQIKRLTK